MPSPWKARALPDIRDEYLADVRALERSTGAPGMLLRAELEGRAEAGGLAGRDRALLETMRETAHWQSQMRLGELFWVTQPMVTLALEASATMPPFVPSREMPHPCGLMAFAGGLPRLPHPFPEDEGDTGIQMVGWGVRSGKLQVRALASAADMPARLVQRLGAVQIPRPRWYTVFTLDLPAEEEVDEAGGEDSRAVTYLLGAAWHLMQIPTLAETTALPRSPGKRGRQEARRQRPTVQIVDLRRLQEKNTDPEDAEGEGRVYTHRWYVQGHWRRNVPSGPGRSERKSVYIEPYIKGPAGAPLLPPRNHVNVWRR